MQSNAKHMLDNYTEHAEHILCTYLQYHADYSYGQCIRRATLPIGVNDRGKEEEKKRWLLELPQPRAGS